MVPDISCAKTMVSTTFGDASKPDMSSPLKILALEPYYNISHSVFLEGYRHYSSHDVKIWSLPGRKWKWRMRGSAYYFSDLAAREAPGQEPDIVLATDFLNLADWKAICPGSYRDIPTLLYFHENQASYPVSRHSSGDHDYGWINLSSCLAADKVLFNSSYHRCEFLDASREALGLMADGVPADLADRVEKKSGVFPVGIDFAPHDKVLGEGKKTGEGPPVILWNHRWEYDKRPELLVDALAGLVELDVDFRVVICGESFDGTYPAFRDIRDLLGDRLLHLGFFEDKLDYLRAVAGSRVVVSTAAHEFFGISVVEAMYLGCIPVLPNSLSYPEILPGELHSRCLYSDPAQLPAFLKEALQVDPEELAGIARGAAAQYHWEKLGPRLDGILEDMA